MSKRLRNAFIFILALILSFGIQQSVQAADLPQSTNKAIIYLFWGDGCPHCEEEKIFLNSLREKYPQIEVRDYEVWYHDENLKIMQDMAKAIGFEARAVPITIIGNQHWIGYIDVVGEEIEAAVKTCLADGCPDPGQGIIAGLPVDTNIATGEFKTTQNSVINVPLIGRVDLSKQSLLLSTVLISFVDGFNPCSLWVLSMLMALVIHTGSRKKVFLIGMIFLTVTAGVYALFIAGVFSLLSFASFLPWIQAVIGVVSLVFAAINIKDYFWYKEGVSLTISDKEKPGIFQRMRKVLDSSDTVWGLVGATIMLAGGVSLVEFSCTAGFPVLWSNMLAGAKVTQLDFAWLLLVYLVVYQLDEIVIFLSMVFTLRASKLEEKQGRVLKLIGGTLMFTLALVMIIKPSLMNELNSSLVIFGVAIGVALLILLLHRKVLPAFGIWIGSEKKTAKKQVRRH